MIGLTEIVQIYFAILVVIFLHELGHLPKKIKFKLFPPSAAAMQARSRVGGLVVNVMIFLAVFYYKPENLFLQYMGLFAWGHYIAYAILGSIIPEPKDSQVNIKTYVFDDVDNGKAVYFITSAVLAYFLLKDYYLVVLGGLL